MVTGSSNKKPQPRRRRIDLNTAPELHALGDLAVVWIYELAGLQRVDGEFGSDSSVLPIPLEKYGVSYCCPSRLGVDGSAVAMRLTNGIAQL
jgi:hypothetical protein